MPEGVQQDAARSLVALRRVSKRRGLVQVLDEIDLDLAPGEIIAVLGPVGAGKSTLFRAINGTERIDSGSITVEGRQPRGWRRRLPFGLGRGGVGPLVEAVNLFDYRTVLQNVVPARPRPHWPDHADAESRALLLLERLGAAGYAGRYPGELTGAERQRVAIARTLAASPRLMLLDDASGIADHSDPAPIAPTGAPPRTGTPGPAEGRTRTRAQELPQAQDAARDTAKSATPALAPAVTPAVLRSLAADGTAMLVATSDAAFARSIADLVVFMSGGRIIERGAPEDFFTTPRTARARDFLAGGAAR